MNLSVFVEKIIQRGKECKKRFVGESKGKEMAPKEKWLLALLFGLLLAVIFFPMDKKESAKEAESDSKGKVQTEKGYQDLFGVVLNDESDGNTFSSVSAYEQYLSARLAAILGKMDGVGSVEAWVTLAGSSESVLYEEKDSQYTLLEEVDSQGGTRTEETNKSDKTILVDHSGNPYVVKTLQPEVEGVLILAEGAGNSTVKKNILEAVQVLFGTKAHRIKIAKKKVEE